MNSWIGRLASLIIATAASCGFAASSAAAQGTGAGENFFDLGNVLVQAPTGDSCAAHFLVNLGVPVGPSANVVVISRANWLSSTSAAVFADGTNTGSVVQIQSRADCLIETDERPYVCDGASVGVAVSELRIASVLVQFGATRKHALVLAETTRVDFTAPELTDCAATAVLILGEAISTATATAHVAEICQLKADALNDMWVDCIPSCYCTCDQQAAWLKYLAWTVLKLCIADVFLTQVIANIGCIVTCAPTTEFPPLFLACMELCLSSVNGGWAAWYGACAGALGVAFTAAEAYGIECKLQCP